MRESRTPGSERGDRGNPVPYRDTLLSATIYLILAIPGFVSDRDSTVPIHDLQETRR